jgi:hypothetical protein
MCLDSKKKVSAFPKAKEMEKTGSDFSCKIKIKQIRLVRGKTTWSLKPHILVLNFLRFRIKFYYLLAD